MKLSSAVSPRPAEPHKGSASKYVQKMLAPRGLHTASALLISFGGLLLSIALIVIARTSPPVEVAAKLGGLLCFSGGSLWAYSGYSRRMKKEQRIRVLAERQEELIKGIKNQPPPPNDDMVYLGSTFLFLSEVAETTANVLAREVQAEVCCAIKVLTAPAKMEGAPLIWSIARDPASRFIRESVSPEGYSYRDYSPFQELAERFPKEPYLVKSALRTLDDYKNPNLSWKTLYDSIAIAAIHDKKIERLVGFLCVDTWDGDLRGKYVQHHMEQVASQVYDVLDELFRVEAQTQFNSRYTNGAAGMGWTSREVVLVPANPEQELLWSLIVRRFKEMDPLVRIGLLRPTGGSPSTFVGPQRPRLPLDTDAKVLATDLDALIPDYAISAQDREIEQLIQNLSSDEFMDILREIAEGNPYAENLMAARRRVLGEKPTDN
jgi:hypothetical protein